MTDIFPHFCKILEDRDKDRKSLWQKYNISSVKDMDLLESFEKIEAANDTYKDAFEDHLFNVNLRSPFWKLD